MNNFTTKQEQDIFDKILRHEISSKLNIFFDIKYNTPFLHKVQIDNNLQETMIFSITYPNDIENISSVLKDLTLLNNFIMTYFKDCIIYNALRNLDINEEIRNTFVYQIDFIKFKQTNSAWKSNSTVNKYNL